MSKRTLVLLFTAALFAGSIHAQTVDEILDKNIKAKGGLEKMKAVKTMRITGKMSMGSMEAPFTMLKARPASERMDFTIQGMTGTQAFDGTNGWMLMPFMGKKDPEAMSEEMVKQMKDEADFDGPTIDYKEKGNKVEYLGKADIEGTPAYKLKVTTKEGNEAILYIDAETNLDIRVEAKRKIQGQEIEAESTIGNWKSVDGLMIPFSIENRRKGMPGGQTLTIEKVEMNPTLAADTFTMPKKQAPKEEPKKQ